MKIEKKIKKIIIRLEKNVIMIETLLGGYVPFQAVRVEKKT